jgi:5-methylcytosine-specific restriction protein B
MLLEMNQRIEVLLDKEHCIGHAYFLPLMSDPTLDGLTAVFKQQILPLLQEYFFEDWERIGLVLNDYSSSSSARFIHNASEVAKSVTQLFSADLVDKFKLRETRWSVNESALTSIDSYLKIAGAAE